MTELSQRKKQVDTGLCADDVDWRRHWNSHLH